MPGEKVLHGRIEAGVACELDEVHVLVLPPVLGLGQTIALRSCLRWPLVCPGNSSAVISRQFAHVARWFAFDATLHRCKYNARPELRAQETHNAFPPVLPSHLCDSKPGESGFTRHMRNLQAF